MEIVVYRQKNDDFEIMERCKASKIHGIYTQMKTQSSETHK